MGVLRPTLLNRLDDPHDESVGPSAAAAQPS
jgi:hypothetical protein